MARTKTKNSPIDDLLFHELSGMHALSYADAHDFIIDASDPWRRSERFWRKYQAFCLDVQRLVRLALERGRDKAAVRHLVETVVATTLYAALCKYEPEHTHAFPAEMLPEKQTDEDDRKAMAWYRDIVATWVRCACEGSEDISSMIAWRAPGWLTTERPAGSELPARQSQPGTEWIWSIAVGRFRDAINNARYDVFNASEQSEKAHRREPTAAWRHRARQLIIKNHGISNSEIMEVLDSEGVEHLDGKTFKRNMSWKTWLELSSAPARKALSEVRNDLKAEGYPIPDLRSK